MLTVLRDNFKKIIGGVASTLLKLHLTPSTITVLGFCLAFIASFFYAYPIVRWHQIVGALLFFVSGFCDVLDGSMARLGNQTSKRGEFLDSILDRYADVLVITGITIFYGSMVTLTIPVYIWGFLAVSGSILVSYARAKAESLGVRLESVGFAERSERMFVIILLSFTPYLNWALIILACITHITVGQRIITAYHRLKVA